MTARLPAVGGLAALLDEVLDDTMLRDIRDSAAANTWRAYRADLVDYGTWSSSQHLDWLNPNTVVAYFHQLETAGAAFATIDRRRTAITKLVEALAVLGRLDPADNPTRHARVDLAVQAIRRRLGTDQEQAAPLTGERLVQLLLSIGDTRRADRRDTSLILIGWYGAMRRSELAGIRRDHLTIESDGVAIKLPRSKSAQTHAVWIAIARQPRSRWDPVTHLEDWLDELDRHPQDAGPDVVWPRLTRGDTFGQRTLAPLSPNAINDIVGRRVLASGLPDPASYSAHSLRAGWVSEAKNRGLDEADIMRHSRHKSIQMMRLYDRTTGWWNRNPTGNMSL